MEACKIIFLSKWVICRFQPLIFQGVILSCWNPHLAWKANHQDCKHIQRGLHCHGWNFREWSFRFRRLASGDKMSCGWFILTYHDICISIYIHVYIYLYIYTYTYICNHQVPLKQQNLRTILGVAQKKDTKKNGKFFQGSFGASRGEIHLEILVIFFNHPWTHELGWLGNS